MAEVEIDQSNLPRVQEVRQCFAVLEDGALAHNLQEQEIEQYYTTNIQKNQLVQKDIRVAKRLQDEEEEEQAQQSTLHRQSSRQLEMEDFEYARLIQEEIQRCAEEARRREQDDTKQSVSPQEMAKQMQEEEKRITRISRGRDSDEGRTIDPALPSPRQHTLTGLHQGEAQYSSSAARWRYSTSHNHSDLTRPPAYYPRGVEAEKNTTSWSNQGHFDFIGENGSELSERLSEDSDSVFSEQHSAWSQRLDTAPPRRRASLYQPADRNYRSLHSRRSYAEEGRGERTGNYHESGDIDRRNPRHLDEERDHSEESQGFHRGRDQGRDCRSVEVRERPSSRSKSVRLHDRRKPGDGDLARTWSCTENPDKHVRFQDGTRSPHRQQGGPLHVWEMLGQVLRERGVSVRFGCKGAPLQIRPAGTDGPVLHGSDVSCSDPQPDQAAFRRAATTRHSFHGDIREGKRYQENSGRDHRDWQSKDRNLNEISSRDSGHAQGERGGSRRWKDLRTKDDGSQRNATNYRVERTRSQQRSVRHEAIEERLSSGEEGREAGSEAQRPLPRAPQRTRSLGSGRASIGDRRRRAAAGAQPEPGGGGSLDLREMRQVLQDEELAHRLQEEENSETSPCVSYPEGDFRVAQVAQDEEIAHFMQKQEIKAKRRSRELEGPAAWREHRAMISGRAERDRPVHRERLDSEGLPSPTEDGSPENQPPSPFSTIPQGQQFRNIAEELDPTFQAARPSTEGLRGGPEGPTCQSLPPPQTGLNEEATFIPPTKRKTDKSGPAKSKRKENCKHQ
ncbi:coiled-coil domain-containing protein 187 isoform 2-T5 [Spinachia spinachia]